MAHRRSPLSAELLTGSDMRGAKTMDTADPISWGVSLRHRLISIVRLHGRSLARARRRAAAGFTLVEVIVAIGILSLTLTVLLNLITNSIRQTIQAERMAEAGSLAQSL